MTASARQKLIITKKTRQMLNEMISETCSHDLRALEMEISKKIPMPELACYVIIKGVRYVLKITVRKITVRQIPKDLSIFLVVYLVEFSNVKKTNYWLQSDDSV